MYLVSRLHQYCPTFFNHTYHPLRFSHGMQVEGLKQRGRRKDEVENGIASKSGSFRFFA